MIDESKLLISSKYLKLKSDKKSIKLLIKDKINETNVKNKEKNPGIELLRIIGMYAIIVHHVLLYGGTFNKYRKYKGIFLMNILSFWHVSSFGLISGIIGNKTSKYSNLLYLWICTVFYSVIIHLYYKKYHPNFFAKNTLLENFFPVIYDKYWYFTSYFGMYLFIPLINKGLSIINKNQLKIIVISIIGIFIIWRDFILINYDAFRLQSGYSVLNLLIFYITGAYLGKFVIKQNKNKTIVYYFICILIYISSSLLCYYFNSYFKKENAKIKILINISQLFSVRINSLAMIFQVLPLTLIFTQIKYNKYFAKILIYFGHLTFGVYLIHFNEYIKHFEITKIFRSYPENTPFSTIVYLVYMRAIQIYIVCLIIDYLRYLLFKIIKIRELCIFIDNQLHKLLNF